MTRHRLAGILLAATDFLLVMANLTFAVMTTMGDTMKRVLPVADYVNDHAVELSAETANIRRLNRGRFYEDRRLREIAQSIPGPIDGPAEITDRLTKVAAASGANRSTMHDLAGVEDVVWTGHLDSVTRSQLDFWSARARELCVDSSTIPPSPVSSRPADRFEAARFLEAANRYGEHVWALYADCMEPRTVVIDEELLHFKVDKADEFESDPEPALRKTMKYVDEYLRTHDRIYVLGHTDVRGSSAYNDALSYRRALYVAGRIREHLALEGRTEGRDYTLYPVGMGEYRPVTRLADESDEPWWKRCRRIELSFRSSNRSGAQEEQ